MPANHDTAVDTVASPMRFNRRTFLAGCANLLASIAILRGYRTVSATPRQQTAPVSGYDAGSYGQGIYGGGNEAAPSTAYERSTGSMNTIYLPLVTNEANSASAASKIDNQLYLPLVAKENH